MVKWKAYRNRNSAFKFTSHHKLTCKICRFELLNEPKYQLFRRLIRNDLAERLVKSNLMSDEIVVFRKRLGLYDSDSFSTKEQTR